MMIDKVMDLLNLKIEFSIYDPSMCTIITGVVKMTLIKSGILVKCFIKKIKIPLISF